MTQEMSRIERDAFAGFWQRLAAYMADSVLLTVVLLIFAAVFVIPDKPQDQISQQEMVEAGNTINLMGLIFTWLYFTIMESSLLQATFGKKIFGLKVVGEDGERISVPKAFLRVASKILSALPLFAGFAMIAFTARRQGLHDLIADTYVVKNEYLARREGSSAMGREERAMKEELSRAYKNVLKDYDGKKAADGVVDRSDRDTKLRERD